MPEVIDHVFPYLCFAYGAVMTFALNIPALDRIADERMPLEWVARWRSHRGLALLCLGLGAAWILQNLWLA